MKLEGKRLPKSMVFYQCEKCKHFIENESGDKEMRYIKSKDKWICDDCYSSPKFEFDCEDTTKISNFVEDILSTVNISI